MPPTIQVFKPRVSGPSSLGLPQKSLAVAGAGASAAGSLGRVIQERGFQLKKERDLAVAKEAFIDFRGRARGQYAELTSLKGKDAAGIGSQYDEWYNKESSEVFTKLENFDQQGIFEEFAVTRRERDLDSMAVHEATERKSYLISVMGGVIENSKAEMLVNPFSQGLLDDNISEITESINAARPGLDNSLEISKAEAELKIITLQEQARVSPEIANDNLKRWKDDLGAAYSKTKDIVDVELVYARAVEKFPDSYAKQKEWIREQKGISAGAKDSARSRVIKTEGDADAVVAEQKEVITEEWFDLFDERALTIDQVENDPVMNNEEKSLWKAKIKAQDAREVETAADRQAAREQEAELSEIVDINPTSITPAEIYAQSGGVGQIPASTARTLIDRRDANLAGKGVKEAVKAGKAEIKNRFNRGDFGDITKKGTKAQAKFIQADIMIDFDEFVQDNPTASSKEVQAWLDSKLEVVAAERSADQVNGFWDAFADVNPFQQSRRERLDELDDLDIARRLLTNQNIDAAEFSDEELTEISGTTEFNQFKTQLLTQ